jgi:uncharacterized protein YjdB
MKKVFLFSMMMLVCMVYMTSCKDKDETVPLTAITVTPDVLNLYVGSTGLLKAEAVPKDASGVQFVWTSSDSEVASVDDGAVTAKKVGTATITVSSGSISKSVVVTVTIEQIALIEIRVDRPTVVKSVDDTAKVTASAYPANATNVVYTWTSNDEEIATVDQNGIITIKGVGPAIVKVSCGTVSKDIAVTGTIKSIAVKDAAGQAEGQNPLGSVFQLFATIDPVNTGITPEWFVNNENIATVDENGKVTVIGSGTTLITARVGDIIGEYMLSTESLYDDAQGYWTFDDPNNLGTNLIAGGGNLEIDPGVKFIEGMNESDGAIRSIFESKVDGSFANTRNLKWYHTMQGRYGADGKGVGVITILMDLKLLYQDKLAGAGKRQGWCGLYAPEGNVPESAGAGANLNVIWCDWGNDRDIIMSVNVNSNHSNLWPEQSPVVYTTENLEGNEPWVRLVFTVASNIPEGDHALRLIYYLNGVRRDTRSDADGNAINVGTAEESDPSQWSGYLKEGEYLSFLSLSKNDKTYKPQCDVSRIAVWNRLLTDDEVKSLGGIDESQGGLPSKLTYYY